MGDVPTQSAYPSAGYPFPPSLVIEGDSKYVLYANMLCPWAHRANLAAIEKGVPFTYVKVPLKPEISRDSTLVKPPHFIERVNPAGTVPAIEFGGVGGSVINESDVCVLFLEDAFRDLGVALKPADPVLAARANHANKTFDPTNFYKLLSNQDPSKDQELVDLIESMLTKWIGLHLADLGPYVCGAEFSHADIMAFPHIERFRITLKHFRGFDVLDADSKPWRKRLALWFSTCRERESAKRTCATPEFYLDIFGGHAYLGSRGTSIIGQ